MPILVLAMQGMERGKIERLMVPIPIRVLAFGAVGGDFAEETQTIQVNRAGARIPLRHRVAPGDTLRIINLSNLAEADFRVVGRIRLDRGEITEWGVECLEPNRNIWGIDFPSPLSPEDPQAGALLVCQGCGKAALTVLSLVEVDIIDSTGVLQRSCDQCMQFSAWAYAGNTHRPTKFQEKDSPPARSLGPHPGGLERRVHKRMPLKLPIRVRTHQGEQVVAKTENLSKGGVAVCLSLLLRVGEIVGVVCPYTEGDPGLEQRAEVRRRADFVVGERWLYGLQYLR